MKNRRPPSDPSLVIQALLSCCRRMCATFDQVAVLGGHGAKSGISKMGPNEGVPRDQRARGLAVEIPIPLLPQGHRDIPQRPEGRPARRLVEHARLRPWEGDKYLAGPAREAARSLAFLPEWFSDSVAWCAERPGASLVITQYSMSNVVISLTAESPEELGELGQAFEREVGVERIA